jgi:hypothetical protein
VIGRKCLKRVSETVGFQFLTSASMNMTAVSLKKTAVSEVRTASNIRVIALMMEAVSASETSVYFKETTSHKAVIIVIYTDLKHSCEH